MNDQKARTPKNPSRVAPATAPIGVYIHVPFCERRCPYCDFVSGVGGDPVKYTDDIVQKIASWGANCDKPAVSTVYFGGGTPSFIDPALIARILGAVRARFSVTADAEITIECNPNSLTDEKLRTYKNAGINRISIGVQSFSNETLRFLGRLHTAEQGADAVKLARKYFDNISIDLMHSIGAPLALPPADVLGQINHVSAYCLHSDKFAPISDEQSIAEQVAIEKLLRANGFYKYEISNFCRVGFECRHNLNYWRCGRWVGFGRGAKSSPKFSQNDRIMMGLRLAKGVPAEWLSHKTTQVNEMLCAGYLHRVGENVACTDAGFLINNQIILKLIDPI